MRRHIGIKEIEMALYFKKASYAKARIVMKNLVNLISGVIIHLQELLPINMVTYHKQIIT